MSCREDLNLSECSWLLTVLLFVAMKKQHAQRQFMDEKFILTYYLRGRVQKGGGNIEIGKKRKN